MPEALTDAIHAANTRAEEGQRIFGPIAALWDDYLQSDTVHKLPTKLRKPLLALCQEMSRTATRHFDAYIKGTKPSQPLLTPQSPASTEVESVTDALPPRAQTSTPLTYA